MRIVFLLWAQLRLSAGVSRVEMDFPDGTSLGAALDAFFAAHRDLKPHRPTTRAAVGNEYAGGKRILRAGDEVSLIPPVQGG
jgi:molybdopterin converting factor small subunit